MTEEQAEAIDTVHFTAVKNQLVIKLEPGDIEIFNKMALLHARNGFKVTDEAEAHTLVHDSDVTNRALTARDTCFGFGCSALIKTLSG